MADGKCWSLSPLKIALEGKVDLHSVTKLTRIIGVAGTILSGAASANAACGPAFDGAWDTRIMASQGQYTKAVFINNSRNGALHATTETGTKLSSGDIIYNTILAISYDASYGNLKAKRTDKTTCLVTFKRPRIDKDTYGVANRVIARQATLMVSGRSIRWCWMEKGHMLGDCVQYRKGD